MCLTLNSFQQCVTQIHSVPSSMIRQQRQKCVPCTEGELDALWRALQLPPRGHQLTCSRGSYDFSLQTGCALLNLAWLPESWWKAPRASSRTCTRWSSIPAKKTGCQLQNPFRFSLSPVFGHSPCPFLSGLLYLSKTPRSDWWLLLDPCILFWRFAVPPWCIPAPQWCNWTASGERIF